MHGLRFQGMINVGTLSLPTPHPSRPPPQWPCLGPWEGGRWRFASGHSQQCRPACLIDRSGRGEHCEFKISWVHDVIRHKDEYTILRCPCSLPISLLMLGAWKAEIDKNSWIAPTIIMTWGVASQRLSGAEMRSVGPSSYQ